MLLANPTRLAALADPPGFPMWVYVPDSKGSKPRFVCRRGTNALEGYHTSFNKVLMGSNNCDRKAHLHPSRLCLKRIGGPRTPGPQCLPSKPDRHQHVSNTFTALEN